MEVARFFWSLLVERTVVTAAALAEMTRTVPLDKGWAAGYIKYGAGLMVQQTAYTRTRIEPRGHGPAAADPSCGHRVARPKGPYPPSLDDWGSYLGHGGDTYGFLSEQGWVPQLNATFAVVANEDFEGNFVKNALACALIQMAAEVLRGEAVDLGCVKV